jgi:nicotinamidase-related amidase
VLLTGVLTNQCVGATCKDALYRDFKPVVVEDCVGTVTPHLHDPALEMIRVGWGQVSTLVQTLDELRGFPSAATT